ncbi:hypothetical protein OIE69_34980 [Actinacidiphila glaucinigra]|uniref:hypothetical protein n=1 Tax=Actinacidiphila glaucinigra TaxID=235986 RepID=UPI002DDB58F5|nr:hypothetical protein [Actinacidiphila glaucinigra]WSD63728.1 hypothetical protein OIE69_34980 [Actinacidiphila glaucinigra]
MFHRVPRHALAGCVASVLVLSGCTAGSTAESRALERRGTAAPATASSPSAAAWQDPSEDLDDATVWLSTGRRSGGLEQALPAKPAGGTVYVATQCQGRGTLTVDAGRYGTSTEHCSERPDGSLNGAAMRTREAATRLKVTASPGVTWAIAVGWDRHAPQPPE